MTFLFITPCIDAQPDALDTVAESHHTAILSTCLPGRDTVYLISPYHDDIAYLLPPRDLPYGGNWVPALEIPGVYNSCSDSNSIYIYTRSAEGCPDVTDTATFRLTVVPPCDYALQNMCFTEDAFQFTAPQFPEANGLVFYSLGVELNNWPVEPYIYLHETFALHFDSTYHLIVPIDFTGNCAWISLSTPNYSWTLTPFGGIDSWWECDIPSCIASHTTPFEAKQNHHLTVYPSPASDEFFYTPESGYPVHTLQIVDMNGKRVLIQRGIETRVDVRSLPKGMYVVQIQSPTGIRTGKWIKM